MFCLVPMVSLLANHLTRDLITCSRFWVRSLRGVFWGVITGRSSRSTTGPDISVPVLLGTPIGSAECGHYKPDPLEFALQAPAAIIETWPSAARTGWGTFQIRPETCFKCLLLKCRVRSPEVQKEWMRCSSGKCLFPRQRKHTLGLFSQKTESIAAVSCASALDAFFVPRAEIPACEP